MDARRFFTILLAVTTVAAVTAARTSAAGQCCHRSSAETSASDPAACPMHDGMADASQDMRLFHELLARRDKIRRVVQNLPNGIHTVTRSDDPEVARMIRTHVAAMTRRVADGRAIHLRDPLFAELFRNAPKIRVSVEPVDHGVHVIETSDDPYTVKLLQEHAGVVNLFIERGMSEMHRDHAVPRKP